MRHGTLIGMLRRRGISSATLVGIDLSEDMIAQARRKITGSGVKFQCADAAHIPFPNSSFDFVVSALAFHHMPPGVKIRAIQEISRVIKSGGQFLVADFGRGKGMTGRVITWFLNFHSYTKGNMMFLEDFE